MLAVTERWVKTARSPNEKDGKNLDDRKDEGDPLVMLIQQSSPTRSPAR